jgi:hypothetical protein
MSRRSSCCFLGVAEGVDDGVDAGGEVVRAAAELIVAGERDFVLDRGWFACAAALFGVRRLRRRGAAFRGVR